MISPHSCSATLTSLLLRLKRLLGLDEIRVGPVQARCEPRVEQLVQVPIHVRVLVYRIELKLEAGLQVAHHQAQDVVQQPRAEKEHVRTSCRGRRRIRRGAVRGHRVQHCVELVRLLRVKVSELLSQRCQVHVYLRLLGWRQILQGVRLSCPFDVLDCGQRSEGAVPWDGSTA